MDFVMPPFELSVHLLGVHLVPGKLLSIVGALYLFKKKKASNSVLHRNSSNVKRAMLPLHLHQQAMEESHGGKYAGHFSGPRYTILSPSIGGGKACVVML